MPNNYFDTYAKDYDAHFTHSHIGKMQRHFVYKYLKPLLNKTHQVFEINCGTGEDAIHLASLVLTYNATDASPSMTAIGEEKKQKQTLNNLSFETASIQDLPKSFYLFNFIFSNFGGLNCLSESEIKDFATTCNQLKVKTDLVFVIMSSNCLWEKWYYRIKKQNTIAFRRHQKEGVPTKINEANFTTYYYSPKDIIHLFKEKYTIQAIKPIGLFVPPSYLEGFFVKHLWLLKGLYILDKIFTNFSFLSNRADHYLIHLKKTN
jgi:SAM-dependent methyltransferase